MKRILITGHTGMLGRSISEKLRTKTGFQIFGVSKTNKLGDNNITEFQVNLIEEAQVTRLLADIMPDIIIHTAAFTNMQFCEDNIQVAFKLHVRLSEILARYRSARTLYISTDSVFKGDTGLYTETDPVYPLNYYAFSKLQGEWATLQANPQSLIIRTNIYGFKHPFGNSLVEWALKSLGEGKQINGFNDVIFNPLYVGQLADIICKLLDCNQKGVLNVGSSENMSKFTFLKRLASVFGFPENLIIESNSSSNSAIKRPKNTTLNIGYLKDILNEYPSISTGLNMLKSDYTKYL